MSSSTSQRRVFPLELRKVAPPDGETQKLAVVEGRAVPFGEVYDAGIFRERVDPTAIGNVDDLPGIALTASHGEPVGVVTAAEMREDGLHIVGELIETPAGLAWDALMRHKPSPVRGLSIGFQVRASRTEQTDDGPVEVLTAIDVREIALTHMPAYKSATINTVRSNQEERMEDNTTAAAVIDAGYAAKLDALRGRIEDMETRAVSDPRMRVIERNMPLHSTSGMEWFRRGRAGENVGVTVNTRAWAGILTSDIPPLVTGFARELLEVVSLGRPFLNALGTSALTAEDGMQTSWPKLVDSTGGEIDLSTLVGNQATQLTEIASVKVKVANGTSNVRTIAGGGELSYQVLDRSTPSFQEAYLRLLAEAWAEVSETAALAEVILDASVTNPITYTKGDPTKWTAALRQGKRRVERATGAPAKVCAMGDNLWDKITNAQDSQKRDLYAEQGPSNASGANSPAGGLVISGVVHVNSPYLDPDLAILTNDVAVKVKEDSARPVSAEDVRHLGRDVAIYGYQAVEVRRGGGVVELSEAL